MIRDDDLTPPEQGIRDAIRELPPVAADAEFRERLRADFRSGRLSHQPRPSRAPWALAASLLLLLGGLAALGNRGEPWTVVASNGLGVVHIDGRAVDLADREQLAVALRSGVVVSTDSKAEFQIASADTMTLVVTPGTTTRLPAVPGRWFGREVRASLDRGEVRGVTGPAFAGARLRVDMPAASVEVSGTTFAVLHNDEGSCVCVLEGEVSLRDRTGSFVVAPQRRRVVAPGEATSRDEPLRPMETMKLEMLRDQTLASRAR